VFAYFALLAGCQRMSSQAHFLSDVVWGAAAGCLVAVVFLPGGVLAWQFDGLEPWLKSFGRQSRNNPASAAESSLQQPLRRDAA
jgi:hypothetical protein